MMEFLFNRSLSQHSGSGSEASEMSSKKMEDSPVRLSRKWKTVFCHHTDNALHQLNDPVAIRIWELLETAVLCHPPY